MSGPAKPSTLRPCCAWKAITAPCVTDVMEPGRQSLRSVVGASSKVQLKWPAGGSIAASCCAATVGGTSLPLAVHVTGR